eukprot:jgi/Picsp_1/6427/NSC_03775-R1_nadh dehydrogenase
MRTGSIAIRSARQAQKSIAVRGGGGGPLVRPEAPTQPLGEQDELTWDDGTACPEPCLDQYNLVTPQYALKWLAGGMASFAALGVLASWSHPEDRAPCGPKEVVYVPPEAMG